MVGGVWASKVIRMSRVMVWQNGSAPVDALMKSATPLVSVSPACLGTNQAVEDGDGNDDIGRHDG